MNRINWIEGQKIGLLHEDVTAKILEACFEVINKLGAGFLESVYQNALIIALRQKGLDLKACGVDAGLLVNFGNPKLEYRRLHR